MKTQVTENTPRVIAVAVVFFGGLAALGWAQGLHDRLAGGTLAALAVFAVAFVAGTYALDREVRAWTHRMLRFRSGTAKSPGGKRAAF